MQVKNTDIFKDFYLSNSIYYFFKLKVIKMGSFKHTVLILILLSTCGWGYKLRSITAY